jgi:ABC-type transporter Mla subunit MlaD
MTANPNPEPTLQDLANKLDKLSSDFDERLESLSSTVKRSNDKFDNYQKATQWVVQLAFTLIASATITVILSTVFR